MANILVVGPHPDDQELGMGGAIARLVGDGHDVLLLDMTSGEPTPYGDPETRKKEAAAAAKILGARRTALDLPNRWVQHTIDARKQVAAVIREHQSQILFVPFFEDAHPDHRAVTRIVEDAR
ncbi:MAG: bacillithiol biosynthesis deacetylase BshB1, partial [Phycisphaeraceae bacterium]